MQVFVVDNKNRPLMPCKARKAKKLLRKGFASVKLLTPFTICLKNASRRYTQDILLGVDAGTKHIGVSAASKNRFCLNLK